MPGTWTSEHDAHLFQLAIEQYKIQGKDLVAGWEKKYGKGTTASAIDQHIGILRKKNKLKTPTKTPARLPTGEGSVAATPTKPAISKPRTPRTPASGAKRKRGNDSEDEMSERDDSEADVSKEALSAMARRKFTPRRSKTPNLNYRDLAGAGSDGEDEISDSATASYAKIGGRGGVEGHTMGEMAESVDFGGEVERAAKKKRAEFTRAMEESDGDVSDFDPRNLFNFFN